MGETDKPPERDDVGPRSPDKRSRYFIVQTSGGTPEVVRRAIEGAGQFSVIKETSPPPKPLKVKVKRPKNRPNLTLTRPRMLGLSPRGARAVSRPSVPGSGAIDVSAAAAAGPLASPPPTLDQLARDLLSDPAGWMATPNPNLGDRKPADLVGTDEEQKVYNLLNAVDQGLF